MAIAANGTPGHAVNGSTTSLAANITTTATNCIVCCVVTCNGGPLVSVTGSGLTFTFRGTDGNNVHDQIEIWTAPAASTLSAVSITATQTNAGQYMAMDVFAFSGADTSSPLDGAAVTGNPDPLTISTSVADTVIVGCYRPASTQNPTAGTGFTAVSGADFQLTEYNIVSSIQTNLSVTMGTGAGQANGGVVIAIKAAAAGVSIPTNQNWPLPIARPQMPQSWTVSYNLNLLGKDAMAPGRQSFDLTQRFPPTAWPKTWSNSYNLNLIGQDSLPVGEVYTDAPRGPPRSLFDWKQSSPFWLVKPFLQTEWTLPIAPPRLPQSITASYNLNLIGQDNLPIGRQVFESGGTYQYPASLRFLAGNVTTLSAPARPFSQYDWPLPVVPVSVRGWEWWFNLSLVGQDTLPSGEVLDRLILRQETIASSWTWSLPLSLVAPAGQNPFSQYNWPTPIAHPYLPSLRTWIDPTKLNLLGKDAMAPGDQSFDLARGIPPTSWIRTWTWYALPIPYLPPNPSPFNQYDWPLPFAPRPAQQLRTWAQSFPLLLIGQDAVVPGRIYDKLAVRGILPPALSWTQWYPLSLIGQDSLPTRQQDWPLPFARPFFQQAPVSFLVSGVVSPPFAQYDWPIPVAPKYPANLRTAAGLTAQQLSQITIPVGDSIYDLTGRPPHPISLRSYVLSLGPPAYQASLFPFRQVDWPLPKPPLYMVQLRTWMDPVRLNLLGKDTRFFVFDRPLPQRQPEPDHSFAYCCFPGLISATFAICAHTEVTAYAASTRVSSATSTTQFVSC